MVVTDEVMKCVVVRILIDYKTACPILIMDGMKIGATLDGTNVKRHSSELGWCWCYRVERAEQKEDK